MRKIKRCIIVWVLIFAMAAPALPAEQPPQQQARLIPRGSHVVVELKTHRTVEGKLGTVGDKRFNLDPLDSKNGTSSTHLFDDVSRIRYVKPKHRYLRVALTVPAAVVEIVVLVPVLVLCGVPAAFGRYPCDIFGPI